VIWRRLLIVLVALGLAVSALSEIACAHPGHGTADGSTVASESRLQRTESPDHRSVTPRPVAHGPRSPAFALAIGALVLLASLPGRRRVTSVTVALLLLAAVFEGVLHAALHLHHVSHPASLAIGAAVIPAATSTEDTGQDVSPTLSLLGPAAERYETPASHVAFAPDQGRAPPPSAL